MEIEEIKYEDKDFPKALRTIENPPKKLYVLGNKKILNNKGFSIVGSRDCTKQGIENAKMFSANIAKAGFTIISGMAKGIDTAAHIGALKVKGKTIAVLGNGPNVIFPPQNKEVYNKILKNGGAIISEYKKDEKPEAEKFRQRNRIVSGLGLGLLVVEAEKRSGTSITARYAKEQGKDIFCVANARENRKGIGTNILIQKGAKLVLDPSDIIKNYTEKNCKQISIEDLEKDKYLDLSGIKKEYKEIYKILLKERSINDISKKTGIPIKELYEMLFMMELEGIIESKKNKYKVK